MGYVVRFNGIMYLKVEGELKTAYQTDNKGNKHNVYVSGAKLTPLKEEATVFETTTQATKYQQLVGFQGKRGQIVRVD